MNHPLIEDFQDISDAELQERISDLSKKFWQTQNPSVKSQMVLILDQMKEEMRSRTAKNMQNQSNDDNKDLDNLINIS